MRRPSQSFRAIYARKLAHLGWWILVLASYLANHALMRALNPGSTWTFLS